jgi:hypothetical protein
MIEFHKSHSRFLEDRPGDRISQLQLLFLRFASSVAGLAFGSGCGCGLRITAVRRFLFAAVGTAGQAQSDGDKGEKKSGFHLFRVVGSRVG